MRILGLIFVATGIIIVLVARSVTRQVPRDYDYDSDDGFLELLNSMSRLLKMAAYIIMAVGIGIIIYSFVNGG